jgi:hypothetical protein
MGDFTENIVDSTAAAAEAKTMRRLTLISLQQYVHLVPLFIVDVDMDQ